MSELYRDFIDRRADEIITDLGGTITPAPTNTELYRDFLGRKFDDVIAAIDNVKVKSFSYTGDGINTRTITLPEIPKYVLSVEGFSNNEWCRCNAFKYGTSQATSGEFCTVNYTTTTFSFGITYNGNEMTFTGINSRRILNAVNATYTVYYI